MLKSFFFICPLRYLFQAVKASHDHHHGHHGQHQEELFVGRAMHEVTTRIIILDISTSLDLQTKPGLSCARQDKPNTFLPLHQLWRTGTGKETLRGSCPGTFYVPFEALMQVS